MDSAYLATKQSLVWIDFPTRIYRLYAPLLLFVCHLRPKVILTYLSVVRLPHQDQYCKRSSFAPCMPFNFRHEPFNDSSLPRVVRAVRAFRAIIQSTYSRTYSS